jgi:hypothetical protein
MGGKELFPEEILPKEGVLKACAKEGRDCGTCVAMVGWLTDMVGNERWEKEERDEGGGGGGGRGGLMDVRER